MVVDMEEGTLSFIVDGTWLGVAHSGLKGQKVIIINSKTGPDPETGFTNPEYISTKLSLLRIANTIERSFKNFSSIDLAILKKHVVNVRLSISIEVFVSKANLQDPPVRQSIRYLFKKNLVWTTPPKRLDGLS